MRAEPGRHRTAAERAPRDTRPPAHRLRRPRRPTGAVLLPATPGRGHPGLPRSGAAGAARGQHALLADQRPGRRRAVDTGRHPRSRRSPRSTTSSLSPSWRAAARSTSASRTTWRSSASTTFVSSLAVPGPSPPSAWTSPPRPAISPPASSRRSARVTSSRSSNARRRSRLVGALAVRYGGLGTIRREERDVRALRRGGCSWVWWRFRDHRDHHHLSQADRAAPAQSVWCSVSVNPEQAEEIDARIPSMPQAALRNRSLTACPS